jgi:hypothetical protein
MWKFSDKVLPRVCCADRGRCCQGMHRVSRRVHASRSDPLRVAFYGATRFESQHHNLSCRTVQKTVDRYKTAQKSSDR